MLAGSSLSVALQLTEWLRTEGGSFGGFQNSFIRGKSSAIFTKQRPNKCKNCRAFFSVLHIKTFIGFAAAAQSASKSIGQRAQHLPN